MSGIVALVVLFAASSPTGASVAPDRRSHFELGPLLMAHYMVPEESEAAPASGLSSAIDSPAKPGEELRFGGGGRFGFSAALGRGWAFAPSVRVRFEGEDSAPLVGVDFDLRHYFDRFTGELVSPYVLAGLSILSGSNSRGIVPALLVQAGGGLDVRLFRSITVGLAVRAAYPISGTFYGPFEAALLVGFDL